MNFSMSNPAYMQNLFICSRNITFNFLAHAWMMTTFPYCRTNSSFANSPPPIEYLILFLNGINTWCHALQYMLGHCVYARTYTFFRNRSTVPRTQLTLLYHT